MKPTPIVIAAALACVPAQGQEVVLKLHHFLPPQATIQAQVFNPWCEKVGRESGGKIKCQIYPAMQLGGTPPQLFDQAKDGVADIVWTLPTYQAGRFIKSEVFELPFMAKNSETGSPAIGSPFFLRATVAEAFSSRGSPSNAAARCLPSSA